MLRPGEAADAIGIKPSTLRVYAQRFAPILSEDASAEPRLYSARDVELLRRARQLVARGLTYERALADLGGAPPRPTDTSPLTLGLQALQQAVEAWRQLAEARADEIAELRAEMRRLQDLVTAGSRLAPVPKVRKQG